jgi:hypothetical protein
LHPSLAVEPLQNVGMADQLLQRKANADFLNEGSMFLQQIFIPGT